VYLIATLQNLGRLMLRYHFADEALQIQQLTAPTPANRDTGAPEQPGLSEEAAAYAVLGIDIEALGAAVGRHWGLSEDVMHMVRRLPKDAPVRKPDTDDDVLRLTASAANDAVDAAALPAGPRAVAALAQVAQRYARALGLSVRVLTEALQAAREAAGTGGTLPPARRAGAPVDDSGVTVPGALPQVTGAGELGAATGMGELGGATSVGELDAPSAESSRPGASGPSGPRRPTR
jgi:non-specific serine/threonine protein kinase